MEVRANRVWGALDKKTTVVFAQIPKPETSQNAVLIRRAINWNSDNGDSMHFNTKITGRDVPKTEEEWEDLDADQLAVLLNREGRISMMLKQKRSTGRTTRIGL